jgi:hypothetical protein
VIPENLPFTFEIIMCFTLNSAEECAGSIFQVDTADVVAVAVMRVCSFSFFWMRELDIRCNNYFAAL